MMSNLSKYLVLCIVFLATLTLPVKAQAAPRLFFDPSSLTAVQNDEFTIQLKIDAESNQVIGSDVVISYAGNDLNVVSITNGGYFPEFPSPAVSNNRIEMHGYVTSLYQSKTGAGIFATLKLKATRNSGSSALSFTCNGSGNDTNILSDTGQNILSCNTLNQVAITYSGGAASTNTPTPTTPPGSTSTPTPTTSGNQQNQIPACTSMTVSATSLQGTPQAINFTCSGSDPGGDITGAEFTFGDGTKQLVARNVGTSGTLTTTHTYTTIGTLGASCRVRDNDYVFSSVPAGCQQTITIRPRPTTIPTQATTPGTTTATTATNAYTTPTKTPTPTTQIVSIISVTPYPTLVLFPSPTLFPPEETGTPSGRFWWIIGGAVSLLLAILLLAKRKPPQRPPTTQMPPIIVTENTNEPPVV